MQVLQSIMHPVSGLSDLYLRCQLHWQPKVLPHYNITEGYSEKGLKADLHGTILSHATSLRHAYDTF